MDPSNSTKTPLMADTDEHVEKQENVGLLVKQASEGDAFGQGGSSVLPTPAEQLGPLGLLSTDGNNDSNEQEVIRMSDSNSWEDSSGGVFDVKEKMPLWKLLVMNCCFLSTGYILACYAIVTLPKEAELISPNKKAIYLGSLLGLAGISQLSGPVAGYFSDRCTHKMGRRRPFILVGILLCVPLILLQLLAHSKKIWWLYYIVFFFSMLSYNILYAAGCGLVPDIVHEDQVGQANGILALFTVTGACLGFGFFELTGSIEWQYVSYAVVLAACCTVTLIFTPEKQLMITPPPWTWKAIKSCYWVDRDAYPDFFWVFISRTLYYMGLSCQAFIQYYLRDLIHVSDPERKASIMAILVQAGSAVVCYPMGQLSDRIGKRRPVVTAGCIVMASVYILMPMFKTLPAALTLGAIAGMGNGTYLSADYALAVDTLPSKDSAARFLGVWGVGAFIGTMLGPMIGGPLLWLVGGRGEVRIGDDEYGYSRAGYYMLLGMGTIFMLSSAYVLRYVKNAQ